MAAGLLAAALGLTQLLLIARLPWLERSFGQGELIRRHRHVAVALVFTTIAHIVLVTAADREKTATAAALGMAQFILAEPSALLAASGTGLLLAVAATSSRLGRRRLRRSYERWHLIHLTAYLALLLTIPHQLCSSDTLEQNRWVQGYWLGAYATAYTCVLTFRLVVPLWRSWYYHPLVSDVVDEGNGYVSIYLRGARHDLQGLGFQAGHFGVWRVLDGGQWTHGHPFSLSASPKDNQLRITVRPRDGSRRWINLPVGSRVLVEGPYGRLTDAVRTRHKVALIAAGGGVTPMRALLEGLDGIDGQDARGPRAVLLYREAHEDDVLFAKEWDDLVTRRGCRVQYLLGHRGGRPDSWLPARLQYPSDFQVLLQHVPDLIDRDVYICGPPEWMLSVERAARYAGVPPSQIHVERFGW